MKQQNNNNPNKNQNRKSEHFKFNQYEDEDQNKLYGIFSKRNIKNTQKDLIGRWEDYATLESDQFSGIRELSEYTEFQKRAENISKIQQLPGNHESAIVGQNIKQIKKEQKKQSQKNRFSEYQPTYKKQPFSEPIISNMKIRQSTSSNAPFDIPQVSQIKKYEQNQYTRNSQKYLLDILEDKKKNFQKVQQQRNRKKQITSEENQNPQIKKQKINKKQQKNRRQEDKQIEMKQQKPLRNVIKRETNFHKYNEEGSQRPKRVTIQDKGKIKFTTDSISGQFDQILPEQLRNMPSSKKKVQNEIRQQQIKFQDPQYDYQPMDIVNFDRQNQKKQIQSSENINKNKEKTSKVKYLNEKRKPVQRVTEKSQKESKSIPDKEPKEKSKSQDNRLKQSKNVKKQTIIIKSQQKKTSEMQEQKRKIKKNTQMLIIQTVSSANSEGSNNSRPKRNRTGKLKYWQNQKAVYNKQGVCLGISISSSALFLQILGFTQIDRINANNLLFSDTKISIILSIKALQKLQSSGINYSLFRRQLRNANEYKKLSIQCSKSHEWKGKFIQFTLQDNIKKNGQEELIVDQQQTFSIQNTSDKFPINIDIVLYKP